MPQPPPLAVGRCRDAPAAARSRSPRRSPSPNEASNRYTVVEVNARDRPALLAALAAAIHDAGTPIHSAHIATYGERAVDVFYLTARDGGKIAGGEIDELRARAARSRDASPAA